MSAMASTFSVSNQRRAISAAEIGLFGKIFVDHLNRHAVYGAAEILDGEPRRGRSGDTAGVGTDRRLITQNTDLDDAIRYLGRGVVDRPGPQ